MQADAPSGTAAYLHVYQRKYITRAPPFAYWHEQCVPLHGETLKSMQETLSNVGILFIENIFTMVSKRLLEAYPH